MSRFRYLNGIDWVVTGLDHSLRQAAGIGNWAQVVLELDGVLDRDRIASAVKSYASQFSVLQGHAARGWHLVPLWKTPRKLKSSTIPVVEHLLEDDASWQDVTAHLTSCLAVPPGTPGH